jgi:hypothetical protein
VDGFIFFLTNGIIYGKSEFMEVYMRRTYLLFIFSLLVFACQKNDAPSNLSRALDTASQPENETAYSGPAAAGTGETGYALRVGTGFYVFEQDTGSEADITRWEASLPLGERFLILDDTPRKALYRDTSYTFIKIRRETGNTTDGLVIASNIAMGGALGVITEDKANVYRSPRTVDVTGSVLSTKTVLVYFPNTERDGFVEFKAYDPAAKVLFSGNYIRLSAFSTRDADIQSSILLQTAQSLDAAKNKVQIEALLESALLDYPDSVFAPEIQELINPGSTGSASLRINVRPSAVSFLVVNDNNVNVRDAPDGSRGGIVFVLLRDTKVTVSEETAETFTINGTTDRWYHIIEPVDGWVFGDYLE